MSCIQIISNTHLLKLQITQLYLLLHNHQCPFIFGIWFAKIIWTIHSGKIHTRCFFSLQHSHITHPKSQYMQLFCKLVRIYKTRIGNKTKSVFSSLRFDFKAQKSYKNTLSNLKQVQKCVPI